MRRFPTLRFFAAVVAVVGVSTGCATGQRPSLVSDEPVNDVAIAAVLDRLARADNVTFTATYDIIPSSTGTATQATVRQVDDRRRVTIGDVEFFEDGTAARTCVSGGDCVGELDDARVSDLNITHEFWGKSFADRLAVDAGRNVAPAGGRTDTIAGQPTVCADVPIAGGTVSYCALDVGVLARYFGADVSIELTSFEPTADDIEI